MARIEVIIIRALDVELKKLRKQKERVDAQLYDNPYEDLLEWCKRFEALVNDKALSARKRMVKVKSLDVERSALDARIKKLRARDSVKLSDKSINLEFDILETVNEISRQNFRLARDTQ